MSDLETSSSNVDWAAVQHHFNVKYYMDYWYIKNYLFVLLSVAHLVPIKFWAKVSENFYNTN